MSKAKDIKNAALSALAKKMFRPDESGRKAEQELRDIADGKDPKQGGGK